MISDKKLRSGIGAELIKVESCNKIIDEIKSILKEVRVGLENTESRNEITERESEVKERKKERDVISFKLYYC